MVNKVILIGNVGQDPEVRQFENSSVARVSLATSESWKDKNGDRQSSTEWHNLEIWGNLVKVVESYIKKGSKLYIEGSIKTDSYKDAEGNEKKATKIKVVKLTMLGENSSASTPKASNQSEKPLTDNPPVYDENGELVDDLPF